MLNPWLKVPSHPPYVLPCDSDAITVYNASAADDRRVQTDMFPEPFMGNPRAPVLFLNLNPGFGGKRDLKLHRTNRKFQSLVRKNYRHATSDFPLYFLDPRLDSPGRDWAKRKLKWLLKEFTEEKLARSIFQVEYFPYHAEHFHAESIEVPSQQYGFELVRSAVARRAVILIMRSERLWKSKVPELKRYSQVFRLNSWQNVAVSPGNCPAFDCIVSAIC